MMIDERSKREPYARVARLSLLLKWLTTIGMMVFVAFSLSLVIVPDWFDNMVRLAYPEITIVTGITGLKRTLLLMVLSVPLTVTLYGLWNVRMLFDCYARSEVFSRAPSAYIRNVGLAMLLNVIVSVLIHSIGSVLLTYDNPIGSRQLSVSVSSDTYLLLILGGLLVVIGWVMQEANRISDENSRFV